MNFLHLNNDEQEDIKNLLIKTLVSSLLRYIKKKLVLNKKMVIDEELRFKMMKMMELAVTFMVIRMKMMMMIMMREEEEEEE